jgi:hypothetical protein
MHVAYDTLTRHAQSYVRSQLHTQGYVDCRCAMHHMTATTRAMQQKQL